MKVVIVTGGSRGIGRSVARACARSGIGVIVTFNTHPAGAEQLVREVDAAGGRACALRLDVRDIASFDAFRGEVVAALRAQWGRESIDGLVNNAGHGLFKPIEAVTEEEFDGLFQVHLKGPFFLTQALLPLMAEGSQVVNISSATTRVATAGVAPYAAFKGGLEILTRYMAKEFGPRRIRANAIAPGAIRTDLGGGIPEDFERLLAGQTALGRIGETDDVGRVVASLFSADNGWINAQTIEVSGGYMI